MKKKILKVFLSILAIAVVVSSFAVTASAASKSVTLTVSDKWVYTGTVSSKGTKATVYNAASSKHDVYGIIQYKSGSEYVTDREFLVDQNASLTRNSNSYFSANKTWRLQLNPYGVGTKNCTADGTIYTR